MAISERTLKRWRCDALTPTDTALMTQTESEKIKLIELVSHYRERILRLTQELLDANLLARKR